MVDLEDRIRRHVCFQHLREKELGDSTLIDELFDGRGEEDKIRWFLWSVDCQREFRRIIPAVWRYYAKRHHLLRSE